MILKNRKFFLVLVFSLFTLHAFSQISDDEVIKMAIDAQKSGMSQQQIGMMLIERGATKDQLDRIYQSIQQQGNTLPAEGNAMPADRGNQQDRTRKLDEEAASVNRVSANPTAARSKKKIFGHDIFNNKNLSFEPQVNIATPENYVFGPGDEVYIDVWGASEVHMQKVISPDGNIIIEGYGPIYLAGLTTKEAESRVRSNLSNIYSGLYSSDTHVKLTLGQIRSIKVNVMGEVAVPGTYTLSSLASVFHALYVAGGINDIGSLRSIKVNRGGQEIADIDVYNYILKGHNDLNISLREGDMIVVPPYKNHVEIVGKVKRPMVYEMTDTETIKDILEYAGGFTGDAYKTNMRLIRKSEKEFQVFNLSEGDYDRFALSDGDEITVDAILQRYKNVVTVSGAVFRPGIYAIDEEVTSLLTLIKKAEGVTGDAFMNRAILYRMKKDLTIESMPIDIASLLNGTMADMQLQRNDELYIPSIFDIREDYTININGAIRTPGTYKYAENMSVEDLIIQAGGLLESASVIKIDIARRLKDPKNVSIPNAKAEIYTISLQDGFIIDGPPSFVLQPFDEVYVRNSPAYKAQENVSISGEVYYGGSYAIAQRGERLTDLIDRAGGLTKDAYIDGATLHRKLSPDEKVKVETMLKLIERNSGSKDSIAANTIEIRDTYMVGIDLRKAMDMKGSDYDIVLKEGDRVVIPEYNGTVKISGAVMYPNTVVYSEKMKLKDYINMAGGQADNAKVSKAYIVYMNGSVSKAKGRGTKIKPGCEIIVPEKRPGRKISMAEILSLGTSTASMAALVTSIVNMTK